MRRGAYAWSNTSVKEKVGLSAEGSIHRQRNTVFEKIFNILK